MSLYSAIRALAKKRKIHISQIESDLKMGNGTIGKWNKSIPRADKLQDVADYLGVTPQYLLKLAKEDRKKN